MARSGIIADMETTGYYDREVKEKHPEIEEEWVERVLANPYYTEPQEDGRIRYYGFIPELDKWIRVIVDDRKLHNRFIDHWSINKKLSLWGRP